MAENDRRRNEQERYGYRDDDRDRWRDESEFGRYGRGQYGGSRSGGYGGSNRDYERGGAGEGRGFRSGSGYIGGDYERGYGERGYRGEERGGYGRHGRDEDRGGYGGRGYGGPDYGPSYRYEGGAGRGEESYRRGFGGYGGQGRGGREGDYGSRGGYFGRQYAGEVERRGDYAGGGHNSEEAAQDFGSGHGFGTGYGGERDYDPGREPGGQYLGGMYYGGGEVRSGQVGPGTGYGRQARRDERGLFERAGEAVSSWFGGGDEGQHRGRGPRSYQRSDERIRDDVNDRMTDDPYLDASEIEVQVSNREVTLSGTVSRREDKRRAEDLAESVSGVTHVQNNLRVQTRSAMGMGSDTGATQGEAASGSGMAGSGEQGTGSEGARRSRKTGTTA